MTRDKRANEVLDQILDAWGQHRAKTVIGLSFSSASPIAAVNAPERRNTDYHDSLIRYERIKKSLAPYYSGNELRVMTNRAWKAWRERRDAMVPRETRQYRVVSPIYQSSKFWSEIDQIIGQLKEKHRKALHIRYVLGEKSKDNPNTSQTMYNRISEAKKELRKEQKIIRIIRQWT